ncbi:4-carboxy-4-hydroxy-2-oxoadipate aldolase/oxaloacetate decarboxylase [Pseudonocardia kujensis]|uniref:4-carboxy-4-hydroxy-2-oxoadipate aldolase/oxaloacetate decarboxylase n=1 Tax=Pseudonocardia kujensis TaxID=1128675 RepID=UPI001E5AA546|nr:4-carboxy-4-hydroxy-2-oxoadipate aldolase/oxaloacetate decarboxylase [Pseudonocardia kujensis]MCE0767452.1 4-carboxy-4-hydroxy-2-oxoadipate aldolase/oxaloacetate decarboxylase [Pseudonocardia kujensis]
MTETNPYEEFRALDAATVYEASGLEAAVDPAIRPVWAGARVCGPAVTVLGHPGDNLALHDVVAAAGPHAVLVADVGGHLAGYWGEILSISAQARGIQGLVIDGGVRDVAALEALQFPVFSRGIDIRRTGKFHPGRVNVPVVLGDVPVRPGDLVIGDHDGLAVVPAADTRRVLDAARRRAAREQAAVKRLQAGETTLEVFGLGVAKS